MDNRKKWHNAKQIGVVGLLNLPRTEHLNLEKVLGVFFRRVLPLEVMSAEEKNFGERKTVLMKSRSVDVSATSLIRANNQSFMAHPVQLRDDATPM